MGREVSESCVEGLMMEVVSAYCSRLYPAKPDLAARRIEAIGFQVGHQLSESLERGTSGLPGIGDDNTGGVTSWTERRRNGTMYTMERPRFSDHLEAIKFICKDFWSELFKKQIDNLKTNHRGTFVLQDNRFRWLTRISIDPSAESADESAPDNNAAQATNMHLYFPCGIIRGALTNLGIPCAVSPDISNLPACSFVVRIKA